MSAKTAMILFMLIRLAYQGWYTYLEVQQRKKPLPPEISNIYDENRYQLFLSRETDLNKLYYTNNIATILYEAIILFSPLFEKIDRAFSGKPYAIFLVTYLVYEVIAIIDSAIYQYVYTYKIDEKYGLNKKTRKEFVTDFFIDEATDIITNIVIFLILIYAGEHMAAWTRDFSVSWKTSITITSAIFGVLILGTLFTSLISIAALKKKYTFMPMEQCEVRDKIEKLLVGAKKVKQINVYDESKKSVDKNAFLFRFLWHREFGIADNFMNENSERELLAVLSHEIGHLKHRQNVWNYIRYVFIAGLLITVAYLIKDPRFFLNFNRWTRESFHIAGNNYYILLGLYGMLLEPISLVSKLYSHFISRREEKEADLEAVKNGYGEDLIHTFKKVSSEELIDIYPHPVIEFIEADHPGMYSRISYIRKAADSMKLNTAGCE